MTLLVDDVCTDADLEAYTLGACRLQDLLPDDWYDETVERKVATIARQQALDEVVEALSRRRPPIYAADVTTPSELRTTVIFGALAILYHGAITHEESPHKVRAKHFAERFQQAINSLQPTTKAGLAPGQLTVRLSRG